jgi:hypothetical protein
MKRNSVTYLILSLLTMLFSTGVFASESLVRNSSDNVGNPVFPNISEENQVVLNDSNESSQTGLTPAIWPFDKKDESASEDSFKPKSSRKAFFLSLLLPGLGETYVGSKRNIIFFGVEAFAWWMYATNTKKGNDIEDDYQSFADKNWHYDDITDANQYNYWEWLKKAYSIPDSINSRDFSKIDKFIETKTSSSSGGGSVHNLPSTKTQQYYEMTGKYDQFVFGWSDIDDNTKDGVPINPNLSSNGYNLATDSVNSPMRTKYMNMRGDSNDKLKAGQTGLQLMMINRIVSAVDAARLAYHHNQKNKSDLSMVRVRFVQKQILDNKVPMLLLTKSF